MVCWIKIYSNCIFDYKLILSYPTVVQCSRKKDTRLISQTLLNDWHSTVLHVSIPKESLLGSS